MKERKGMYYQNSLIGEIGECTGHYPQCGSYHTFNTDDTIKVGDVVSFYEHGEIYTKVVTKNYFEDKYGVFGFGSNRLNFPKLTKILDHKDLTEDILRKLIGGRGKEHFSIKEVEHKKEMTISQIERKLGHGVKIVGE